MVQKCLTICQPYASLIVTPQELLPDGQVRKRIENRRWATSYRGPLLIHAGKSRAWFDGYEDIFPDAPFGAIVGRVNLVDCLMKSDLKIRRYRKRYPWSQSHIHAEGPFCWILDNAVMFEKPIPYPGSQGIFGVPDAVVEDAVPIAEPQIVPHCFFD